MKNFFASKNTFDQIFQGPKDDFTNNEASFGITPEKPMPASGITELVFIVDRSGSMMGRENDTIGGLNAVLERHRQIEGHTLVSLVLFDDVCEILYDRVPLEDVAPLTSREYWVRGCTALLDAVGGGVQHIDRVQRYMPPGFKSEKVIFVIITDGAENASKRYSYGQVKQLIEKHQDEGWEFMFLGANIDAVEEAGRIGIAQDRAETYVCDEIGNEVMYHAVAQATADMRFETGRIGSLWKEDIVKDRESRA